MEGQGLVWLICKQCMLICCAVGLFDVDYDIQTHGE